MERTTFFEHYRINSENDASPVEISRTGPVVVYQASDLRSGAPVALTLLPIASVDSTARARFEEQARVAQKLDHINIAKIHIFAIVDDQFVFVSEYGQGETVESWIAAHGPLSPDAVLRVALQVVSALSAGSFHGLTHPAIQPSNLMIVSGRTAEGGWPCVKLMNFGLAGLELARAEPGEHAVSEFAGPEQLQQGTTDFRSEIYSLGATMCFMLTGAFYSAEPRSLQTRRFARSLRNLITPTLHQNPDERPQDPVLFAQALRSCLDKVERRQMLAQRFGIPFNPVRAKTFKLRPALEPVPMAAPVSAVEPVLASQRRRAWLSRRALAFGALLLALAVIATVLLPAPVAMILHQNRSSDAIGIPVGVSDNSAAPMGQKAQSIGVPAAATSWAKSNATASVPSPRPVANQIMTSSSPMLATNQNISTVAQQSPDPVVQASPTAPPMTVAIGPSPSPPQQTTATEASPQSPPAEGPQTVWERESSWRPQPRASTENANAESDVASRTTPDQSNEKSTEQTEAAGSKTRTKSREVASTARRFRGVTSNRARSGQISPDQSAQSDQRDQTTRVRRALPAGSFRAHFVGTTPAGNLILRLPSGRTVIVPPPGYRRLRRLPIERGPMTYPPPPFVPMYPAGELRD